MGERQVGVRELRQNLSTYLRRVERGERLVVTERRRPVAVLAPLEPANPRIAQLVAAARAMEPTTDILSLLPPSGRTSTRAGLALLEDQGVNAVAPGPD